MKLTKKLLSLLLVFALAFCFVACGDPKPCDEHIDENNDGVCDREGCGALIPGSAVSKAVATSYVDAVFDAIKAAKTITFVADIDTTITKSALKDKAGNLMTAGDEDRTIAIDGTATIKLSYIEQRVDFMCELELTTNALGNEEQLNEAIYFIDGLLYTETDIPGVWLGTEISAETIMAMLPPEAIEALPNIDLSAFVTAPTEDDIAAIKTAINDAISSLFTVNEDGSIGVGFDASALVNPYLQAIKAIDGEDTIASIVNPYLMSAGVPTTLEALCEAIAASGDMTVGQIYSALNVYLTQTVGKNLQGIFDEVMAIPELKAALIGAEVCTEEQFERVKNIKLDTLVADYTASTVDGLLASLTDEGKTPITAAQLGEMAKAAVITPLSEMNGFSTFEAIMELTTLDAAYGYLNIDLDSELGFEGMSFGNDLAFVTVIDFEAKDSVDYFSTISVDFAFEISITAISTETATIALPEGATVLPGV